MKNQKQEVVKKKQKIQKRFQDVEDLNRRRLDEELESGYYLYDYVLKEAQKEKDKYKPEEFHQKFKINFSDLPISKLLLQGLEKRSFVKMTEIQRCTIPHALASRDVMGASKTGSGKTLAYLIPVVENLYVKLWTPLDGLGALIILPTRELAIQVFEVFNSIAEKIEISVGLIIGGKNVKYEKEHIQRMNVLICTPGRLLQHMEETPNFDTGNLQILVIDEADILIEMGFQETLRAILRNIPKNRQTLLFSATLNKKMQELATLCLQKPERISLYTQMLKNQNNQETEEEIQKKQSETLEAPTKLMQYYMVVELRDKIDVLFSFLKAHQKQKILIFFSTCKQVRFIFETFKKLKLGTPILELHGRQKAAKRMAIFFTFQEKKFAFLMTTNLAARGLDFPQVDWIVQFDCPENQVTYIHRVGRTARYKAHGKSLLFLQTSELKFLEKLKETQQIHQINPNPQKQLTITDTLQAFVAEDHELRYLAQRAFASYVRSVFLESDKSVFDVKTLDLKGFSESLGLIQTPQIQIKNTEEERENSTEKEEEPAQQKKLSKLEKLKEKIKQKQELKQTINASNQPLDTEIDQKMKEEIEKREKNFPVSYLKQKVRETQTHIKRKNTIQEEEDDFLVLKSQTNVNPNEDTSHINLNKISKNQLKKIKPEGHFGGLNKIIFAKDGSKLTVDEMRKYEIMKEQQTILSQNLDFSQRYSQKLEINRESDKLNEKARRKEKQLKRKLKGDEEFSSEEEDLGDAQEQEEEWDQAGEELSEN